MKRTSFCSISKIPISAEHNSTKTYVDILTEELEEYQK